MKEKTLVIINIGLGLIAVLFLLSLFEVELPTLGMAMYWVDPDEAFCVVSFGEEKSVIKDVDLCCFELQKQLKCEGWREVMQVEGENWKVDKRCVTGLESADYFVNSKTFNYCRKEGYRLG